MAAVAETKAKEKPVKPRRVPIAEQPLVIPFTTIIDTREGAPYSFQEFTADKKDHERKLVIPTKFACLKTGDYSIEGFEHLVCVERKSASDLVSSIGRNLREQVTERIDGKQAVVEFGNFEEEHQRMAAINRAGGRACVIVEAPISEILNPQWLSRYCRLNSKTIHRIWLSWWAKYGVPWLFVDGRRLGEVTTFRLLEKWWGEQQKLIEMNDQT